MKDRINRVKYISMYYTNHRTNTKTISYKIGYIAGILLFVSSVIGVIALVAEYIKWAF